MISEVPEEVWYELDYEIARAGGLECTAHYRAYRLRDGFGRQRFLEIERENCCGLFETWIKTRDGDKWIVACSYGH